EFGLGDILLTVVGTIGRVAIISDISNKITFQRSVAIIRFDSKIFPMFGYYQISSDRFASLLERSMNASAQGGVYLGELAKINIQYPHPPHQRKIARILTTIDNTIEKNESAIEKYKAIKQGMMHDLFTRGVDVKTGKLRPSYEDAPELYKETELGMIPKEWDVERLENITEQIGDGIHATPKYINKSEYFFINGNNLENGKIVVDEKTNCVNESEFKKHYIDLGEHTILISINGTIGNIACYKGEKVILGKSAAYINCGKKLFKDFFYQLLQSYDIKKYFDNELTGSTIKNLSLNAIRNTPTLLPTYTEQVEIAKKVSSLDLKLEIEQNFISKSKLAKQALMQDLLTGKKEVTPDPEDFDRE
ncbi:MAG: restriction endonuclease subunit S, partial [Thermodesulfobacteriota bacterium]|nr:restriction endonuclease subunit S [Thermodesulfobacteriota bacterium]